ncbi:MAG: rhodanese family protein [Hyphomicrobium sp.]
MSQMQKISPKDAKALIDKGAVLIDIREGDERARAQIAGSGHLPLSKLDSVKSAPATPGQTVVFHCKSGNRTAVNASKLLAKTPCEAYILDGGIDAWTAAGFPVVAAGKKPPMEIIRQVMIVAGTMALMGVVLGLNVSPVWFYLSAFVGLGLIFSGVTGYCLMAYVLRHMPWNKGFA